MAGASLYQYGPRNEPTLDPPTKRSDNTVYVKVVYQKKFEKEKRTEHLTFAIFLTPLHVLIVSDDRNDRTAGTTGKLEWQLSQNGRKAETIGKAGTTWMIPASIYWSEWWTMRHH